MHTFYQTEAFAAWLRKIENARARAGVLARIRSAELGDLGDCDPVGEGVSEIRLHIDPGYRLYLWQHGPRVFWLLTGGDVRSRQHDIDRAKALRREIEELHHDSTQHI